YQQVRVTPFANELLALDHAELLLLIDDDQAQVVGRETRFNQGVSANAERVAGRGLRVAGWAVGQTVSFDVGRWVFDVRCPIRNCRCLPVPRAQQDFDAQGPEQA